MKRSRIQGAWWLQGSKKCGRVKKTGGRVKKTRGRVKKTERRVKKTHGQG